MRYPYGKGSKAERELLKKFWENKVAAIRVAGSGKATTPACDIIAGKNKRIAVFECKATKKNSIYLEEDELHKLDTLARVMGCRAFIACRFSRDEWFFVPLGKAEEVKKIRREDCKKSWALSFPKLLEYFYK